MGNDKPEKAIVMKYCGFKRIHFPSPGIISVVQSPFDQSGGLDLESLRRLLNDALEAGVDGFLAPVVASECSRLDDEEKKTIITEISKAAEDKVPFIAGVSSSYPTECVKLARYAADKGAAAFLAAVPNQLYKTPKKILPFFQKACEGISLPLIIQDFEFQGSGMTIDTIKQLEQNLPLLAGLKIETAPAGPKYTQVRRAFGDDFLIAGGWAVPQFIEALDRGVDAMIPESSMLRVYKRIQTLYRQAKRDEAVNLFRKLLPVLAFTNQEVNNSILFFKRLLVKKEIFKTANMRADFPFWDEYSNVISDELIDLYLEIEDGITDEY